MNHIDQDTLASLALGMDFPASLRAKLEAHLVICQGCMAQYEELCQVNEEVARRSKGENLLASDTPALPVRTSTLVARDPNHPPAQLVKSRGLARVTSYVRRNPVTTGSAFMLFALIAAVTIHRQIVEPNLPAAIVRMNPVGTALQILDETGSLLGTIPVSNPEDGIAKSALYSTSLTELTDLNGNGLKEIITATGFFDGTSNRSDVVRGYDQTGTPIFSTPVGQAVTFRGVNYVRSFDIIGILPVGNGPSGAERLLVGASNPRSPFVVSCLDRDGRIKGEYWHYGWLPAMTLASLEGWDHNAVVLCGTNDVNDIADSGFAAIVVVDPMRISGSTESCVTPGFGYPASDAEIYYVRADTRPLTTLLDPSESRGRFFRVNTTGDSSIVLFCGLPMRPDVPFLTYTFSKSMKLVDVSFEDHSRLLLMNKYLPGASPETLEAFQSKLEAGVSYWNGDRWTHVPTRIAHPSSGR